MSDYHKGEYIVGFDVHKRTVACCVKEADGTVVRETTVNATRPALLAFAASLDRPWVGALEATLFTGWIYDTLKPQARALKVGHPYMLKAIAAAKKKNDRVDARMLADLLRCDLFPECYMAPTRVRELRRVLRYRSLLVREATRMKNKTAGLLMEVGAGYDKARLHGKRYFHELLGRLEDVPESVVDLLKLTRSSLEIFERSQRRLLEALKETPELQARVERLQTIPGVGEVVALTWALEVDDPERFPSLRRAVSYCGLCAPEDVSAGVAKHHPLSKQRNVHLQTMLIEAAKLAPRYHARLAQVYEAERARGAPPNEATLAVARKLVAYLLAVDKRKEAFAPKPPSRPKRRR